MELLPCERDKVWYAPLLNENIVPLTQTNTRKNNGRKCPDTEEVEHSSDGETIEMQLEYQNKAVKINLHMHGALNGTAAVNGQAG